MFAGVIAMKLTQSPEIVKRLAAFKQTPAIYTGALPPEAKYPAALIIEAGGDPWGCRARRGTESVLEVRVFDNKEFTRKDVSDLARLVWQYLDRAELSPWIEKDGYEQWDCQAREPGYVEDGIGFPGYLIRVQIRALEIVS